MGGFELVTIWLAAMLLATIGIIAIWSIKLAFWFLLVVLFAAVFMQPGER
jgi:hypothetical protein